METEDKPKPEEKTSIGKDEKEEEEGKKRYYNIFINRR